MDIHHLKWCFTIKTGLSLVDPNENLARVYERKSAKAVKLLKSLDEEFDEWIATTAYYALYHKAYAILLRIGVRSKNHTCTRFLLSALLPEAEPFLARYKDLREDTQYYGHTRIVSKERILADLASAFNILDAFSETLTPRRIQEVREKIRAFLQ